MKSTITLFALFAVSFSAAAQIKKSSTLLGTDFSFGRNLNSTSVPSNQENNSTSINIGVNAGKATKDNFFVGGGLLYSLTNQRTKAEDINNYKRDANLYGASVWVRQYYPLMKSFYAFINAGFSVSINADKIVQGAAPQFQSTQKSNGWGIDVAVYPGISYQMRKRFFLDASINTLAGVNYNHRKTEQTSGQNKTTSTSNSYGLYSSVGNGSSPLQLGVRWIIPGKG